MESFTGLLGCWLGCAHKQGPDAEMDLNMLFCLCLSLPLIYAHPCHFPHFLFCPFGCPPSVCTPNHIPFSIGLPLPIFSLSRLPLISRCGASLQHLPHPQRHPALHGRPVYSCQWVLQVTPQHHPQRRDLLCVCRSVKHPQNETKAWEFVKPSALILNWLQTIIRTHSQAGQFRIS